MEIGKMLADNEQKILDEFNAHLIKSSGLQYSTIKMYTWCMDFYFKNNLNPSSIEDYNGILISHSVKKRSNVFYSAFKRFIKFYIEDGTQKTKMVKALIYPKENNPLRHRKFLNFRDRKQVINSLEEERHRLIAKIQFYTGCRVREILKLQKGDIFYEEYEGDVAMILNVTQKGGQKMPIWILDKDLEEEIDAYTLSDFIDWQYYFMLRKKRVQNGDEISMFNSNYIAYWRDLKQSIAKCGYEFKDWATHDFRRGIASDVWSATKDPLAVQRALRHKRFDTTLRYLNNAGLQSQELFENLKNVYNK